jgi:SAM-dependent methyltransferase
MSDSLINPWTKLVKDEPTFYIARRGRAEWNEEDTFWKRFRPIEDALFSKTVPSLERHQRAVAIGASVGRFAIPLARRFRTLVIVDPSTNMLQLIRDRCGRCGDENIEIQTPETPWDELRADFVCAVRSFDRMESFDDVDALIARAARCLVSSGVAMLQFDTRPHELLWRWERAMPDKLASKSWQLRRQVRRDPHILRFRFAAHSLRIIEEFSANSAYHTFVLSPIA